MFLTEENKTSIQTHKNQPNFLCKHTDLNMKFSRTSVVVHEEAKKKDPS